MLFQCHTLTLYQRYAILNIQRHILFCFQRRMNVISIFIHKVGSMFKCWLRFVQNCTKALELLNQRVK